jgi:hypothetical protein
VVVVADDIGWAYHLDASVSEAKAGSQGWQSGLLDGPRGVAVTPTGDMCVADSHNHCLIFFAMTLALAFCHFLHRGHRPCPLISGLLLAIRAPLN